MCELFVLVALDHEKLIWAVDGGDLSDDGGNGAGADGIAVDGARARVLSRRHVRDCGSVRDSAGFEVNRLQTRAPSLSATKWTNLPSEEKWGLLTMRSRERVRTWRGRPWQERWRGGGWHSRRVSGRAL